MSKCALVTFQVTTKLLWVIMRPLVGLGNTRVSTEDAPKSPSLPPKDLSTSKYSKSNSLHVDNFVSFCLLFRCMLFKFLKLWLMVAWSLELEYSLKIQLARLQLHWHNPNIVGHTNFLRPMLGLIVWIDVGHLNFQSMWGTWNCQGNSKLMLSMVGW